MGNKTLASKAVKQMREYFGQWIFDGEGMWCSFGAEIIFKPNPTFASACTAYDRSHRPSLHQAGGPITRLTLLGGRALALSAQPD